MADHLLGPSGSRRRLVWRRRFFILPVVALAALAFFITSALAVHDVDLFELDRNTQDEAAAGDDWDNIFDETDSAAVTTGILEDISAPGEQFQGGGSKDNNDVSQWLWKAGEPLDKDDITNGYAAGYVVPEGAVDPADETDVGDFIIYFGLDRFANNGSAQVGFWFFKNEIGLSNVASGGGFKFSGTHAIGDILVQSNFSQGGVISSISVFEWVGSGGSHGSLDLRFTAADCVGPPALAGDDPACATVNQATEDAPAWDYTPKFPDAANPTGFPQGSFFEGGLNVSRLIPDAGCLSSFLVETRTSTPFDARLKDFAIGEFNTCQVDVDTDSNPKGGTTAGDNVVPGTSVTDTAIVTGSTLVGGSAPRPTGTVTFFLCQPSEVTANVGCDTGDGTQVGTAKTLLDNTDTATTSDSIATSDATTNTTATGKYCWRAVYTPDATSPYTGKEFTNFTDECFTVVAQPTTTTTRQFVYPQDKANVTASSGGNLTGTLKFELFDSLADCQDVEAPFDVKYTESFTITDAAPPQTRTTTNYPPDADAYAITDGTTHYWKVTYDSTNASQLDSVSDCQESTAVTFAGNDLTITVP